MNNKLLSKLVFSLIGLASVFHSLRAISHGKMEMYLGGSRGDLMTLQRVMKNTDTGFYPIMLTLLVLGFLLFVSCGYDAWRKESTFTRWQMTLSLLVLGAWGVLVLYMLYFI